MSSRAFVLPCLFVLTVAPLLAGAELSSQEWSHVRHEAAVLAGKTGERDRKRELVDGIAREDSSRSALLLLEVAGDAFDRSEKLGRRLERATDEYNKYTKQLRKRFGRRATLAQYEQDAKWREMRSEVEQIKDEIDVEGMVARSVRSAIANLRSPEAIETLLDRSDRVVDRACESTDIRTGILEALWKQPPERAIGPLLEFAADPKLPEARVRVLAWIGANKVEAGFDVAVQALGDKRAAVARAAVAALAGLDDPRCVPPMIAARARADGLLGEELDLALGNFTGKTFFGAGAPTMWSSWWAAEGKAWLNGDREKRFEVAEVKRKANADFYGIETASDRIVFVLDRSGSMKEPVPQHGPVSGSSKDTRVPGATRMAVAKNELARAIRALPPGVKFAVVFYSHEVRAWKDPPALLPATPANKKAAIDWFMDLGPVGSTLIFDALHTALGYASPGKGKGATDPKGADTIFLLSDGAPSTADGKDLLIGEPLEEAVKGFFDENQGFRCVVHTIGVGPQHNRALMQRLAKQTGGTYRAVGMG